MALLAACTQFIQRLHVLRGVLCGCEQAAVDRMLTAPPPSASAEAQQQHLKLLVEVYKRTQNLAEQLQVQSLYPLKPEWPSELSIHVRTR